MIGNWARPWILWEAEESLVRRISSCAVGLSMAMFFAGRASTAWAQVTQPAVHAELVKTLRCAHKLLATADKDYNK